jgi:hypothetical protein
MGSLCCLICVIGAGWLLVKMCSRPHDERAVAPAGPPYETAAYGYRPPQPYLPPWPVCDALQRTVDSANRLDEAAASTWSGPVVVDELVAETRAVTGEALQMILAMAHASGRELWRLPPQALRRLDDEQVRLAGLSRDLDALTWEIGSAGVPGHADRVQELRWRITALTEALREFPGF